MALENITYKSYCWSLGTTSFRTKNFSQKIERQLEILAEFWEKEENQRESWNKNDRLQSRYYDFMKEKGFITGEAPNKPKDAREKTSGLADIGLISEDRRLTEVGQALLKLSKKGDFTSDNVLQIPKDSYIYFKQLLKTSCNLDGRFVRPFLVLAFLLNRLGSLDMEEYTYLLPLCIDRKTIEETAEYIEARRKGGGSVYDGTTPWYAGMDGFILHILLEKENYKKAQELFLSAPVDKELFRAAGMNRKSRAYDEKYLPLYQMTEEVCRKGNTKYAGELYRATKGFQAKIGSQWRQIFFNTTSVKAIEKDPASHLKENFFQKVSGDGEFKTLFFQTMHLIKVKANLSDYQDLNKRYIKNTDLVLFEDGEVKFDIVPRHFFRKRMEELFALAFEESGNLLFNCPVEEIAPCLEAKESEIIEGINQELGTSVKSMDEARDILERERYRRLDRLIDSRLSREDHAVYRDAFAWKHAQAVADPDPFGRDDLLPVLPDDSGRLRRQVDELLDSRPRPRDGHILQKRAELHDEGNLARGEVLPDAHRCDQRKGHQNVRLDVKGRNQADQRFQKDRDAAEDDGHPGRVKGERNQIKDADNERDPGNRQQHDFFFDAAKLQKGLDRFQKRFHTALLLYTYGGMPILYHWGYGFVK